MKTSEKEPVSRLPKRNYSKTIEVPLRVASLNLEGNLHLHRAIPFLKKQNVDVICLQEVFSSDLVYFEQELAMKSHFCANAKITEKGNFRFSSLGEWGTAILTKLPVRKNNRIYYFGDGFAVPELKPGEADSQHRALQYIDVLFKQRIFTIATTHFTWTHDGNPDSKQERDVKKLLTILGDQESFALLGDFNAPRGREIFSRLSRYYKDNIPKEITSTIDGNLHRAGQINVVVDGIFTTSDYKTSAVTLYSGISDHCALITEIHQNYCETAV